MSFFVYPQDPRMFSLEMVNATSMNLIILISPEIAHCVCRINADVNIYVSNTSLCFYTNIQAHNQHFPGCKMGGYMRSGGNIN